MSTDSNEETNQNESSANAPVFSTRIGSISAKIFKNASNGKTFYNTKIIGQYQDEKGDWKDKTSYSQMELLAVLEVGERAKKFLARLQPK